MATTVTDHAPLDATIVKAAIYPSIGVARVGNSATDWYLGPEVPDPLPLPAGSYRDSTGALKREAARFRIYGLNAAGIIVRELTSANANIVWTVQLANKKAAWYGFQLALDIPEASAPGSPPTTLRNPMVTDRAALAITPSACSISGVSQPEKRFDDGTFMGISVYLGSVLTDDAGRLLVLGGHGVSASYTGAIAVTFANNDTWYDDVADGPVTAQVNLAGKALPMEPAWVVVAPPNYGPCRKSVRTLWDLMRDLAVQNGWLNKPARPSFTNDILPIFQRMAGLQWVNEGFAAGFGWKGLFDLSPAVLARLASTDPSDAEWRKVIANQFRTYSLDSDDTVDSWAPVPWPWVYGDAMNQPPALSPRQHSSLTTLQLSQLRQWAAGDFDIDYDPDRPIPRRIEDVPVAEQGNTLTKAALDFCLADAFHPGCEMTWPVRQIALYPGAFPLRSRPSRLGGTRLRHDSDLRHRLRPEWLPGAAGAWRHQPVDGRTLAVRHRQLPLRLQQGLRSIRPHLLACSGAQPGTHATGLRYRHGFRTTSARAAGCLRPPRRLGRPLGSERALRHPDQQYDRTFRPSGRGRKPSRSARRFLPGDDGGGRSAKADWRHPTTETNGGRRHRCDRPVRDRQGAQATPLAPSLILQRHGTDG